MILGLIDDRSDRFPSSDFTGESPRGASGTSPPLAAMRGIVILVQYVYNV